jgi:hypothetical protein
VVVLVVGMINFAIVPGLSVTRCMFISAFLTFCERLRFHVRQSPLLLSMSATPVRKFDRLSLPRFEYYRVLAIGNISLFGLLVFIL